MATGIQVRSGRRLALLAVTAGAVVSVFLGVYGSRHQPTGETIALFGFGSMLAMKVWLAVAAGVLAVLQLLTALWMFGRLGLRVPDGLGHVHRGLGVLAVLVSLPVAYHCLWSLGLQSADTRVLVHSLAGCLVYGAFVVKVIGLHASSAPRWLVPAAGGFLFTVLVVAVLTSAGWYLTTVGLPPSS